MSTGPKENRGGYRPGAGRPRRTVTDRQVYDMIRQANSRAKVEKKTMDAVLLDIIYSKSESSRDRITAIKTYKDFTMGRFSEQTVNINNKVEQPINLPTMRPDPAKIPLPKEPKCAVGTA